MLIVTIKPILVNSKKNGLLLLIITNKNKIIFILL